MRDDEFIICPYCHYARRPEPCDGDNDDQVTEEDCEHWGKTFKRHAEMSFTYYTEPKP